MVVPILVVLALASAWLSRRAFTTRDRFCWGTGGNGRWSECYDQPLATTNVVLGITTLVVAGLASVAAAAVLVRRVRSTRHARPTANR